MSTRRAGSSAAWTRRAFSSPPRRGSPTAASSGWAPRSATRRRSSTPAGRSACASCARSSTSSGGTGTFAADGAGPAAGGPGRRIGILGGTFNPPHIAHLLCAQEAHDQLGLDLVVLMPAAVPPHKESPDDPGAGARVEMCRLAVGDDPRFGVSTLEVERGGASYTVDTLRELHDKAPGDDLTFIVGGDMAH